MESQVVEQNNEDGAIILSISHYTPREPINVSQEAREAFLRACEATS